MRECVAWIQIECMSFRLTSRLALPPWFSFSTEDLHLKPPLVVLKAGDTIECQRLSLFRGVRTPMFQSQGVVYSGNDVMVHEVEVVRLLPNTACSSSRDPTCQMNGVE